MSKDQIRAHLLQKYPSNTHGTWEIKGEDTNPDFGGSHYQPSLGIVEGIYEDVVEYALELKAFISWGGGGSIKKLDRKIIKVDRDKIKKLKELRAEKEKLTLRLAEIEKELGE